MADLTRRPSLKSWEALEGIWPNETARVRTVMDKGAIDMVRTEAVIRCAPEARLVVKVEAPDYGSMAWLDHRIEKDAAGWRLTIGVIATATLSKGAVPISRDDYATLTQDALQRSVDMYRDRIAGRTGQSD